MNCFQLGELFSDLQAAVEEGTRSPAAGVGVLKEAAVLFWLPCTKRRPDVGVGRPLRRAAEHEHREAEAEGVMKPTGNVQTRYHGSAGSGDYLLIYIYLFTARKAAQGRKKQR